VGICREPWTASIFLPVEYVLILHIAIISSASTINQRYSRREVVFPQPLEHKYTKGEHLSVWSHLLPTGLANSRRHTLKDIRGPTSHSFWLGSEKVHRNAKQVGDLEFQWAREYGPTWMVKGCLGEEVLWTADPRALQYVFHTSGYRFSKRTAAIETTRLFTGESILTADSVDHQRHRKIMNPAFGAAQLRTFLPVFRRSAARLSQKWKDTIQSGEKSDGCTMKVDETLSRMTLDIIGEVAFDYRFGVLSDNGVDNEFVQAFNNLFVDTLLYPSSWFIIFQSSWRFFPGPVLRYLKYLPYREYRRFATYLQAAMQTGRTIINEKAADTEQGNKDIISILGMFPAEARLIIYDRPRASVSQYSPTL